ncbi:MAG TPA: YbjQ family protein [Planktothrix sp.]|jgi:uncharacterized protein YbjQ (UPF0145 family)
MPNKHRKLARVLIAFSLVSFCSLGALQLATSAEEEYVAPPMPPIMMTTTESFEGYRIKEYKGIIRGVTVRVPGPMSNFKANLKSIVGGKISPYTRMCETARQQAFDALVARAQEVGANAVVGFRYDSSSYGDSDEMGTEVVCYGTAVIIAPRDTTLKTAEAEK